MRLTLLALGMALMLAPTLADARPSCGGHKKGIGKLFRCSRMLMHASADALKDRLGVSADQFKRIEQVRDNFLNKRIALHAAKQKQMLALRKLLQQDLPNEGKVLAALRKARGLRGKLHEERAKAHLKVMAALTKEQRAKVRARCAGPDGPGGCPHDGWHGKRGRGGHGPGHRGPR